MPPSQSRLHDLQLFYGVLDRLALTAGGPRQFDELRRQTSWPGRGVYFFFERGEFRTESGSGLRVVRVGTHGLKSGSSSTLRSRLSQHRGQIANGGGNHRGSIFRLLVGTSLMQRDREFVASISSWGKGSNAPAAVRVAEINIERNVSQIIGAMPFLWLDVDDEPGPKSLRGVIERNAIGLLSNRDRLPIDPPSPSWLGHNCDREKVRASGLWNQNHVDDDYEQSFLDAFQSCVDRMKVST